MKFVALKSVTSKPKRTDILHTSLFHGAAKLKGAPNPVLGRSFGDDPSNPLLISVCGTPLPKLFQPCLSLVVSAPVKAALQDVPNIDFARVVFHKVVRYTYQAGDFSYYETADFLNDPCRLGPGTVRKRLPHDPSLVPPPNSYTELLLPNMYNIKTDNKKNHVVVKAPYLAVDETECVYHSLDEYAVFWSRCSFFREDIFSRIESFIDWDYFTYAIVDL